MRYRVVKRVAKKDLGENILSDETIQLTGQRTSKEYPDAMRRVKARVKVDGKWRTMVFLTNNFEWSASTIAELYKARWEVELLFKELKQTLQLQDFYGENANAVEWQIWAALLTHLVLRWLKYKSGAACSYSRFAALCDMRPEAVEESRKWLVDRKKPGAMREYKGREDSWKGVCDDPDVDVVYICAPAGLHAEMELYALGAGKHVMIEVPGAQTIDECWAIVEAAEKARRHCMMLENCVYGEMEMLAWNLCHLGLLGTLTHAEGAYIHNLVWRHLENSFRNKGKYRPGDVVRKYGNTYPTHPIGPICTYMDMNRGDRMERVSSFSSLGASHQEFAAATYGKDEWQNKVKWLTGDMNTSIIKTASNMRGGEPVELPDFTRGAWATAKPQNIGTVDLRKMGVDPDRLKKDERQMNV